MDTTTIATTRAARSGIAKAIAVTRRNTGHANSTRPRIVTASSVATTKATAAATTTVGAGGGDASYCGLRIADSIADW